METCKNCGTEITDKYCGHCGQEIISSRLSVKHIIKDATHGILHWESSITKTIKELVRHPGRFIREYIAGKRKPYVKPFSYFIFIQTVFVLIFHWYSDKFLAFVNAKFTGDPTALELEKVKQIQHLITSNINYLNFLMPVFMALFIMLFLKKKTGINYAESLAFSFYISGTTMLAGIILMPLASISYQVWEFRMALNVVYLIFAVIQFGGYSKFSGILRGFLVSFLSTGTYIITVAILTLLYMKFIAHIF